MMRGMVMILLLLAGLVAPGPGGAETAGTTPVPSAVPSLAGQLLVATPELQDPNFRHAVVYMVEHDGGGAVGLVINRILGSGPAGKLLASLGIDKGADSDSEIQIHAGGPVERNRAFLLYSMDYQRDGTVRFAELGAPGVPRDQLPGIVLEQGSRRSVIAFGYAGWGADQLEREIAQGSWFAIAPDEALLFDDAIATKWQRALARRSVDL